MNDRQKKLGVVLSYISQLIHIISGLIYTPIMLKVLGKSENGLYQLVSSTVSNLGLISLGFAAAYLRYYYRYKVKNDEENIAKLNGMFFTLFGVMAVICLICGAFLLINIHSVFSTGLTESEYEKAEVLMFFMVINIAITFPDSVFNCIIVANEKFIFQKVITLLQNLLSPLITLPLLFLGCGSIGMVLVATGLTVSVFIAHFYYCIKKLKIRVSFKSFDFSLLKEMWVFTSFIFINQIIDQINWSVDRYLLGRMINTEAVTNYGVGAQINSLYVSFSGTVAAVFAPEVNRIVASTKENSKLDQIFLKVGRVQYMILLLILSGFIIFGDDFIKLWAKQDVGQAYMVAILLILPVTVPLIQNIGIEIQRAKNMHKARSLVYLGIAIGNILLSIPLIKRYGEIGAATGTTIALVIGNIFFMNYYYHKKIGLDIPAFWRSIFRLSAFLFIPVGVGVLCRKFFVIENWFSFIIQVAVYTAVYLVSLYLIGMNDDEKGEVKKLLKKKRRES